MSGIISEKDVEQLREHVNLVDVVSEYVALKPAGRRLRGLCPFHSEKTPSFFIDPEKQLYHCFGCGIGGDIYSFVMQVEKLSFPEAIEQLAKRAGYQLTYIQTEKDSSDKRARLFELMSLTKDYYREYLWQHSDGKKAIEYLKSRSFDENTLRKFEIGLSPGGWDEVSKFLIKKGFKEEELYQAGISTKGNRGPIDLFRGRIMFPIFDLKGRIIAYGGRIFSGDGPKYLNSPETSLFKKGSVLYNLNKARREMVVSDRCVIVEGYTDVIALDKIGISYAVATLGTALTAEHLKQAIRFTGNIYLAFDADSAGKTAAERGLELIGAAGNARVLVSLFPEGQDPADFCQKHSKEEVEKVFSEGIRLEDFCINQRLEKFDLKDPKEKAKAIDCLADIFNVLKDPIIFEEYLKKVAALTLVREDTLRLKFKPDKFYNIRKPEHDSLASLEKTDPKKEREEELLRILLQHFPESLILISDRVEEESFSEETRRKIFKALTDFSDSGSDKTVEAFLNYLRNSEGEMALQKAAGLLIEEIKCIDSLDWKHHLLQTALTMKLRYLDDLIKKLDARIKEAERTGDEDEIKRTHQELTGLRLLRKNIYREIVRS